VENAISHGLVGVTHGVIGISVQEQDGLIVLSVQDNGTGIVPERLESIRDALKKEIDSSSPAQSIGLYNVNRRIQLHFGKEYGLDIDSGPGTGTVTRIILPKVVSSRPSTDKEV
jgi:two-component system sensor histidine kinase YesM